MRSTLDPTLDVVFKMLFAAPENRDVLIALLTAVLRPASPVRSVEVRNPEVTRRAVQDKGIVLDLLVELEDGTMFDVEMQAQKRPAFRNRALYYWARLFAQVLPVGESYVALVPVISVLFLDYEEFSTARMHSTFQILEVHDHERFSDRLEIHVIELPKVAKVTDMERKAERDLVDWSRFLRANSDEEIREVCMHNPAIKKANQALEALSARPKARRLARERELALETYRIEMGEAVAEGEARGEAKGLAHVASALLAVMSSRGISIDESSKQRVRSASLPELEAWLARVGTAMTVDDVFGPQAGGPRSRS